VFTYSGLVRRAEDTAPAHTDPLLAAAAALWPPPARVHLIRGGGRRRPPGFLLVPSAARPDLLLPVAAPRAAAAIVAGRDGGGQVRRLVGVATIGTAARLGLVHLVARDRLVVERSGDDDVVGELERILGVAPVVGLRLGSARANRKPVLQVLDRNGTTIAFVKIGDNDASRALVDAEAAALTALAGARFRHLRAPEVVHHGTWRDLRLLVLSPLTGRRRWRQPLPVAAMTELARAGDRGPTRLVTSPFWARLRSTAAGLTPGEPAERLEKVVEAFAERLGPADVDLGWGHGDWSPWNMAWRAHGVDVWDWERFERSAPVGADALHHRLQQRLRTGVRPEQAVAALDADAPALVAAVGAATDPAVVLDLYVLDLATRYAAAAQGPLGEHARPQVAWSLAAAERRASA
jgi:hypothetical protein